MERQSKSKLGIRINKHNLVEVISMTVRTRRDLVYEPTVLKDMTKYVGNVRRARHQSY